MIEGVNSTSRRRVMSPRDTALRLEGFRYWYRSYPCAGSAVDPVVFVSGAWQSMEAWEPYAARLSRFAPVVLVDLPGNGTSDALPWTYGLDFLVDALAQVVAAQPSPRINLFSYSYGTSIALRFCQLHARKVKRAILVGAARNVGPVQRTALAEGVSCLRRGALDAFVDCSLRVLMCQDERTSIARRREVAQRVPTLWGRHFHRRRRQYEQNSLRMLAFAGVDLDTRADVPALVFTGEHDPFTPPDDGREVARTFTTSAFTTLRHADHFCLLEQPRAALRLISRFVQELPLDDVPGCAPIERFNRRPPVPAGLPACAGAA